jgi:hypothetical protein
VGFVGCDSAAYRTDSVRSFLVSAEVNPRTPRHSSISRLGKL